MDLPALPPPFLPSPACYFCTSALQCLEESPLQRRCAKKMDSNKRLPAGIPEISIFPEVLNYLPWLLPRFGWLAVLGQGTVAQWLWHCIYPLSFVYFPQ